MMKSSDMKKVLLNKLHDENLTHLKLKDISIRKVTADYYQIQIEDYTPYRMRLFEDEFRGEKEYTVMITDTVFDSVVAFTESKKEFRFKDALIQLGYWAGETL